uniref:Putative apolipophorin-III isoform 1 n=1 Tax=Coptotermes formosanus TaxID=36987 RepID=L0AVE8_COPFO|nr:putative apolipophorin-III isoform 1 [Coptotermes formosanus]
MALSRTLVTAAATLFCLTQILEAGVAKRATTASPSTDNQLQEALTRAQQAVSNAATEVSQALGLNNLPAPGTVASELHNQTLSFARTLGQFVGQLQNEATSHQGTLSTVLQSVAARWNETATNLQTENPEVTRTAQELQTSFNSGLQTFIEEAQKLVNAIAPDSQAAGQNLQDITRTALDRAQETANAFRSSLQTATQSQPAQ